ncbi:hypothetical protein C4588_03335 [Candidatus Parcubacteria bacterium]|nr:MAG: hypothetical protein C4588_03335 [Candidatus Parcubacteria bacterium]
MKYVLVIVWRGIIDRVDFFEEATIAVQALFRFVQEMNPEEGDAAVYGPEGLVANAKHFLDDDGRAIQNKGLIEEVSRHTKKPIYIIGNPKHRLGFMVASMDDPLGFRDPVEAVSELGQMRKDFGKHLKLYSVELVTGAIAEASALENLNCDLDLGDFNYDLVEEYIL